MMIFPPNASSGLILVFTEKRFLKGRVIKPIPDEVKQQAMDAVSHEETRAQIRLVVDNGAVTAPITPGRDTEQIAEKVARTHESGQDMDVTHKQMTQDGFGREYG